MTGDESVEVPEERDDAARDDVDEPPARDDTSAGEADPRPDVEAAEDTRTREELLEELQAAETARDEYLDDLKRARAEFQNFRKRTMREGAEQRQSGTLEVLGRLIDVLDDFELAVLAAEGEQTEPANLRKGVEMVYGKLVDVCKSFGLEKIGRVGTTFDPELHEAVQQVEADEERDEPVVVEVLRPGYRANGRVLRAAMVKVEK